MSGEIDSVSAISDVFVECLKLLTSGVQSQRLQAETLLQECVDACFSLSSIKVDADKSVRRPSDIINSKGRRVIVKKRPSPAAISCRQQILGFFQAVELFLNFFTGTNGIEEIKWEECCAHLSSECRSVCDIHGDCRTVEASFSIVGILGVEIQKISELSVAHPQSIECSVVVDTYETYISRAILVGSGLMGPGVPASETKHYALLPWWLYLSSWSGIFPLKEEDGWSHRMTRNVLFSISDSLVRQSISSSEQAKDSLLGYVDAVTRGHGSLGLLPILPLSGTTTADQRHNSNTNSYREGLSFNGVAEARVNHFLREMSANGYPTDLSSRPARRSDKEASGSPSPRDDAAARGPPRSPRYVSPSVSQFVEAAGDNIHPKKMRKLALQFAVKLGNLYATQDVHAMLSFLPEKDATKGPAIGDQGPLEESHTEEDPEESSNSLSDVCGSPYKQGKYPILFDFLPEKAGDVLREKVFAFLSGFTGKIPLSPAQSQQLSLFIALCLLNRIASFSPPNFGRQGKSSTGQKEIAFGVQFGYEQMVWPLVVSAFLDTCLVGGMCAAISENQILLSKQLAATVTSFMRHCFSGEFLRRPGNADLKLLTRRWVPKCSVLISEALGPVRSKEPTAKHQLLQHLFFLTFYLRSVFEENTSLNSAFKEKTEEADYNEAMEYLVSPTRGRSDRSGEDGRLNYLKNVMEEGEAVLQTLHKCMSLLPWSKVTKAASTSAAGAAASASHSLFSARGRAALPVSSHQDSEFVKYCVHYYLTVLDILIEIALFTSSYPSYLTAILLRYDESDAYLTAPAAGVIENISFNSKYERIGWQHFLNYHCLGTIKDGTKHVDMEFITTLSQWQKKYPSLPLCWHPFDSLHLDHLEDLTPSPETPFKDSWYFLRILNHAKNVTRYICAKPEGNEVFLPSPGADAKDPFRRDVSRFVDGVTPFLSTSSGTFTQSLSVPHQHPFSCLEQEFTNGKSEADFKNSLETVCRDLWLRTQALQLLSAASAPVHAPLSLTRGVEHSHMEAGKKVFLLNGSASKTYVRLLFLRIVQSVFSQHGSYDGHVERRLLGMVSAESKHLYDLAKRLWTSCLTLTLQTIQSMSHHHIKARETAMHLGVHAVLSRLLDALSLHYLKSCNTAGVEASPHEADAADGGRTRNSTTEESDALEDTMMLDDVASPVRSPHSKEKQEKAATPLLPASSGAPLSFAIPQLCLDGIGPALYFVSSGDTGAALQASLFTGTAGVAAPICPPDSAASERTSEKSMADKHEPLEKKDLPPPDVPPLEFPVPILNVPQKNESQNDVTKGGMINPQHLYADAYLLSCAVCCTCSLLVQHSGMLRYESTVSTSLLRKRMHLPEASYHLLYGGDQTWKKHVEDTRNSATLKKYLGWCCSDQRGIRPSFVFRSLRDCIASAASSSFLSLLEKWLDHHSLTYYRSSVMTSSRREVRWRHLAALQNFSDSKYTPISTDGNDDASLHSMGLFVLLRLLIPRRSWNQQFDFRHRLGAGGFGTVMAADYRSNTLEPLSPLSSDTKNKWALEERKTFELHPGVAIKMMPLLQQHDANSGMLPMCHAEVLAMMRLRGSPYIVPLLSFGSSDDGFFIVLPRYDAGSLYDWRLRQYPPGCAALVHPQTPSEKEGVKNEKSKKWNKNTLFSLCCPLITQLLETVALMHSQQIRHNDIKAENLLIDTIDDASQATDAAIQPKFQADSEIVLPRTIRLTDFGSCDTCTDEDMHELLRDVVAGESRFMEGRWGFGNGTEAVQPPEIIVPRWRYELMRTVTLHFVASQHTRSGSSKQPLATSFASVRKQQDDEAGDIVKLLNVLRKIELSADIWGCGCLLYELLTGGMLFGKGNLGRLTDLATTAREQLAEQTKGDQQLRLWDSYQDAVRTSPALDHWDTDDLIDAVGPEVVDFLLELLSIDPLRRPSAAQALEKWKKIVEIVL